MINTPAPPLVTAFVDEPSVYAGIQDSSGYCSLFIAVVSDRLTMSSWESADVTCSTDKLINRLASSSFHDRGRSVR